MRKGSSNPVHFLQAFIEVIPISHEKAVEWKTGHWLCQNSLVHKLAAAGENICQHVVVV